MCMRVQGFLRHYGLEQPVGRKTKALRLEQCTVEFAPPFKHEALRCVASPGTYAVSLRDTVGQG